MGGGAKWGVCALLLSDRSETSALYKSLALRWAECWGWGRQRGQLAALCEDVVQAGSCPGQETGGHPRPVRPPAWQGTGAGVLSLPPCLYRRRYKGKIAFGEALRSNAELSAAFGVSEYPTLLVVCGGNKDVVLKFEGGGCRGTAWYLTAAAGFLSHSAPCGAAGEMKSTKLSRFLNQFYNGKACAAAVKIGAPACLPRCTCSCAHATVTNPCFTGGSAALPWILDHLLLLPPLQTPTPTWARCGWAS